MENLVIRTRLGQWVTLLKQQSNTCHATSSHSTSRILNGCVRNSLQSSIPRRSITTSPQASQQAAARRREQEDSDNDVSAQPQLRSQADPNTAPSPLPREPDERTTLSARHLREPTPPAAAPRRKNALDFLKKARTIPTETSTSPATSASSPAAASSSSAPQPIQTNRSPQYDFLERNPNASFLAPSRPGQPQTFGQPQTQSTKPSTTGQTLDQLLKQIRSGSVASPPASPARTQASRAGAIPSLRNEMQRMKEVNRPTKYAEQAAAAARIDYSNLLGNILKSTDLAELQRPNFRISPSLGRTIAVDEDRGMDVARAFKAVEIRCAVNSVRSDVNKQRFHERGGIRRKRLAMSRWRRRFKEGFKATVRRVEDMRRKGW